LTVMAGRPKGSSAACAAVEQGTVGIDLKRGKSHLNDDRRVVCPRDGGGGRRWWWLLAMAAERVASNRAAPRPNTARLTSTARLKYTHTLYPRSGSPCARTSDMTTRRTACASASTRATRAAPTISPSASNNDDDSSLEEALLFQSPNPPFELSSRIACCSGGTACF
jgi:nicotinamidase-related amidase